LFLRQALSLLRVQHELFAPAQRLLQLRGRVPDGLGVLPPAHDAEKVLQGLAQ
jgi:hypothetical protein